MGWMVTPAAVSAIGSKRHETARARPRAGIGGPAPDQHSLVGVGLPPGGWQGLGGAPRRGPGHEDGVRQTDARRGSRAGPALRPMSQAIAPSPKLGGYTRQ